MVRTLNGYNSIIISSVTLRPIVQWLPSAHVMQVLGNSAMIQWKALGEMRPHYISILVVHSIAPICRANDNPGTDSGTGILIQSGKAFHLDFDLHTNFHSQRQ